LFEAVDAFVAAFGFKGLGPSWTEISASDAFYIVRSILRRDQAYQMAVMREADAARLAEMFCALFDRNVRCVTNGNSVLPTADPRGVPGASTPISSATFDSGVVCVDDARIGMLWVEDED
jgi:hypothetical protein